MGAICQRQRDGKQQVCQQRPSQEELKGAPDPSPKADVIRELLQFHWCSSP
jgi:hypothetical protein